MHTQVEICIALILANPLESTENGTVTDQDPTGDNLLLKHVSCGGLGESIEFSCLQAAIAVT